MILSTIALRFEARVFALLGSTFILVSFSDILQPLSDVHAAIARSKVVEVVDLHLDRLGRKCGVVDWLVPEASGSVYQNSPHQARGIVSIACSKSPSPKDLDNASDR